jgi:adenine-specific DNA-methyltransferase
MSALELVAGLSHGAPGAGNRLIHGDNRDVLPVLADETAGAVRCVYLDPPYNNRERWTHYDDRDGHDRWLAAVEATLAGVWPLLRADGSLWVSIDDAEVHYLKVLADRLFGRAAFVATIVWEHRTSRENRRVFSPNHEYLLVYARDPERFKLTRNPVAPSPAVLARYRNPDADPRGPWQSISLTAQAGHGTAAQFYELVAPNGRRHRPPKGRCWIYTRERMRAAVAAGEVFFGAGGNGVPRLKRFLSAAPAGMTPPTLWAAAEVGTTATAKREGLALFPDEPVFDTPKPEALLRRVLEIATDPGDLVLDAYLGSGTTAAVAHKAGRRWIGIERGAHAVTHCARRMRRVVDGEAGGISAHVGWPGGGGFRFERAGTGLERAA